ncbi:MAG TPA: acyl-CoA thioesterase [Steroidobacteraceae bacterium]|nr:acyl-CoA thioesterase [Steroidobacteraceae bacterium]
MKAEPLYQAEISLEIPFHDLDPAGVVWHGHYAKYLELARCELLKQFKYNYDAMAHSGFLWPVVDLQLRFLRPLRFGDRVIVHAALVEWEYRLRIEYLIRGAATGERLTKASTVQVAVDASSGEMCLRSPDILFERLGVPA